MADAVDSAVGVRSAVVVRALDGLGDMLCAVPALRALRAGLPGARIALVGLPSARPFVRRFAAYVDELIEFPGYPGIPEVPFDERVLPAFLAEMHARRFDLAVQMHGNGCVMNPFTLLLGARRTVGFRLPAVFVPEGHRFVPYPAGRHEIERLLELPRALGMPDEGTSLEFPLSAEDSAQLRQAIGDPLPPGTYALVHPGAVDPARRWPARYFAEAADMLAGKGLTVVLTGTAADARLVASVTRHMNRVALDLSGRTTLGALGVLVSGARVLLTNDTGTSHVAAALRTPSVVVFSAGSDPGRWAPLDRALHRAVLPPVVGEEGRVPVPMEERCLRDACTGACAGRARVVRPAPIEAVEAALEDVLRKEGSRVA